MMMEDRVVERPASPSTTNRSSTNSSNSCNSRDFGKPRRSYYRLFPSVEPTPPASPISLRHQFHQYSQRASLRNSSAAGSYRRRSSSEDNGRGAKDSQLAPHFPSNVSNAPPKGGRKGSLPELSLLRTLQEDGHADVASEGQLGLDARDRGNGVQALEDSNVAFDSVLGQSTEACDTTTGTSITNAGRDGQIHLHGATNGSASVSASASTIGLGLQLESPEIRPLTSSIRPLSPGQTHARSKPRPNLRIAILEQNIIEATPTPPPKSARHVREGSAESSSNGSMYSQTLLQDGASVRDVRVASVALKQSIVPVSAVFKVRELNVAPNAGRLRAPGQLSPSFVAGEQIEDGKTEAGPQLPPKSGMGRWANLPSLHSRFNARAATPEPYVRTKSPEHYAPPVTRPATSQDSRTSSGETFSATDAPIVSQSVNSPLNRQSALATARANVAALSSIEVPTWNASFYEQIKTPGSELGALPSAPLHGSSLSNPAKTLAELAEQCEALHNRYATLRAQRQQLSSGIIANLKNPQPGSEFYDTLLREQLALAAVSSSIDICFAKLKSLECQREDAVASLIAHASAARRTSDELARISRKSSLTPSLDMETRLATGRSTPDLHAFYRPNRPGPIQTSPSFRNEAETQRTRSPLLPRKSSLPIEIVLKNEQNVEGTAVRPPSRLAQVHEPPPTPETCSEITNTPSTTNETDDTQASEISDDDDEDEYQDILDEELKRRSPRMDSNGNSIKAVKVLGIGLADPPLSPPLISPMSILSSAKRKKNTKKFPPHLRLQKNAMHDGVERDGVSPLTTSSSGTLNLPDDDQEHEHEHEHPDLDSQLQSFPSAPAGGRTSTATLPPMIPPLSFGDPERTNSTRTTTTTAARRNPRGQGRNDSTTSTSTSATTFSARPVQRSDTGKSKASAHTINVYFDYGGHYEDLPPFP